MTGFRCPLCGLPLEAEEGSLRCGRGHSFDRARSGYVNLLSPNAKRSGIPGDNREMVSARRAFLDKGYYALFAQAVAQTMTRYLEGLSQPVVLDAGCGEGYYTAALAEALSPLKPELLAVDISKFAADKCARRCPEVSCAVASVYHLPLEDASCHGVVSLFSPYCGEEYQRVLKPGGIFLMGIPGRFHLWELKEALYDEPYENEIKDYALEGFGFLEKIPVEDRIVLSKGEDIRNLFMMTPYYYKSGLDTDARLQALERLETRLSFEILVYRR